MHSVVRVLAVAGLAAVGISCADQSVTGGLRAKLALLPLSPAFSTAPDGGPDIEVERIRGVLKNASGTDSAVAEAVVQGDSAILEFLRVTVTGDSTSYNLGVQAFDANDVLVFEGNQTIQVKPGENPPAAPEMSYVAPDTAAKSLEIQVDGNSASVVNLQWQGAIPNNTACLSRIPDASAVTEVQLQIVGRTQDNAPVANVRVGWTSLDSTVATVDDNGLVRSRCSNKSTSVIARTFTDRADTISIAVTAPPFTLRMTPEAASVQRGSTQQLEALVIDERGNESAATGVTWASSDPGKATVSSTGLVTAIRNGRVQITASSGDRSTVAIVDVVRPSAASVKVIPETDIAGKNMIRQFVARAFDAAGQIIGDAAGFTWSSSNTNVATVDAKGLATTKGLADNTAMLTATIDGISGTGELHVVSALDPGTLKGIVLDGSNEAPVSGATVAIEGGGTSVPTNTSGQFELGGVQQGDNITVSKDGYIPITFFDAPAFPNQTIFVDEIPLPPASSGNGNISGKVINALSAHGVSGVTVTAYSGLNAAPSPRRTATPVGSPATTASDGSYTLNLPAGAYTFVASGTGYSQSVGIGIVIGGQSRTTGDIILPPTLPNSGLYVVLTWSGPGTNVPADLDLHITGPASSADETNRFQVHSGNRSFVFSTDTVATIDVADDNGPGAEVGSVRPAGIAGIYRFYVKNIGGASDSKALADSADARVDVFQDNRIIATFLPPTGVAGTVWEVFRFDGARVTPTGAISSPADPNVLQSQRQTDARTTRPRGR